MFWWHGESMNEHSQSSARSVLALAPLLLVICACDRPQEEPPAVPADEPAPASTYEAPTPPAPTAAPGPTAPEPMPSATPLVQPTSCEEVIGKKKARDLVERCIMVSPATRPPCNMSNPCYMIEDEIRRGCGFLTSEAPPYCSEYR